MDERHKHRLVTLDAETEVNKKKLVGELKRTPIVQVACKKLGVGRSTYYKWRHRDHLFAKACDQAMEFGQALINDIIESKLISMAQNGNLDAMKTWLRANHHKYTYVNRILNPFSLASVEPSIEEMQESKAIIARRQTYMIGKQVLKDELKLTSPDVEFGFMIKDEVDKSIINDYLDEDEKVV
jgi:hypothetical protein